MEKPARLRSERPKKTAHCWQPELTSVPNLAFDPKSARIFAPRAELERLAKGVGQAGAARVLGVDKAHITRTLQGKERVSGELMRRILAMNYVFAYALEFFYPDEIVGWLVNPEPLLGGRNPLGVLVREGPQPVIDAIEARAAGVFA